MLCVNLEKFQQFHLVITKCNSECLSERDLETLMMAVLQRKHV
jgi:hypothetical protein